MEWQITCTILLCFLIFSRLCKSELRKLRGDIYVEHFDNYVGQYLNVYDYEIASSGYETFNVDNEMTCRWIQISTNATVASVGRDTPGDVFECRVHYNPSWGDFSLISRAGRTAFYQTTNGRFSPRSDGFFYKISGQEMYSYTCKTSCPHSNIKRQPIFKTQDQKNKLLEFMNAKDASRIFIGARADHIAGTYRYIWNDGTQMMENVQGNDYTNILHGRITMESDGDVHNDEYSAFCVCVWNIFSLPWDY